MATTHVALIRGINVGTAKRVAMSDLRAAIETLGFRDVKTLLNSGNVLFTSLRGLKGDPATQIEEAMVIHTGVSAKVIVLSAEDLAAAVEDNPLTENVDNPSRLLVAFLSNPQDRSKLKHLAKEDWSPEAFAVGKRVAYLWCPEGLLASKLPKTVESALRHSVTMRNWTTVLKINALFDEP